MADPDKEQKLDEEQYFEGLLDELRLIAVRQAKDQGFSDEHGEQAADEAVKAARGIRSRGRLRAIQAAHRAIDRYLSN